MDKDYIRNKFRTLKRMGKYRRAQDIADALQMKLFQTHRILNGDFFTVDDPQFIAILEYLGMDPLSFFAKPQISTFTPYDQSMISNQKACYIGDVPPGGIFVKDQVLYMKCDEREVSNCMNVVSLKTGIIGGMAGKIVVMYFPDAKLAVS